MRFAFNAISMLLADFTILGVLQMTLYSHDFVMDAPRMASLWGTQTANTCTHFVIGRKLIDSSVSLRQTVRAMLLRYGGWAYT